MSYLLSVSPETLKAAHLGEMAKDSQYDIREKRLKNAYAVITPVRCPCCQPANTGELKNATRNVNNNEKPAWVISYENTVGRIDNNPIHSNNTAAEEELKQAQASRNNSSNSIPNWLITFRQSRL